MLHQVTQFGFIEFVAKVFTQIFTALRAFQQHFSTAAVGAGEVTRHAFADERIATAQAGSVIFTRTGEITAWQHGVFGPRRTGIGVVFRQFLQRMLRQLAIGGQLAAEHRQQRCLTVVIVHVQRVITGDRLR